jgi:hypothetical protein
MEVSTSHRAQERCFQLLFAWVRAYLQYWWQQNGPRNNSHSPNVVALRVNRCENPHHCDADSSASGSNEENVLIKKVPIRENDGVRQNSVQPVCLQPSACNYQPLVEPRRPTNRSRHGWRPDPKINHDVPVFRDGSAFALRRREALWCRLFVIIPPGCPIVAGHADLCRLRSCIQREIRTIVTVSVGCIRA